MSSYDWSDWIDFKKEIIQNIPESSGVFMTHQTMKILLIGNSENIRDSLLEALNNPCTADSTRFRYTVTEDHKSIKEELVNDFKKRHDGNMPKCM